MNIAVIHGPNLNMLGQRDKTQYGTLNLESLNEHIKTAFPAVDFTFFQSNHEGGIIDFIQEVKCDALIINAGGYTHTSVAIRDALDILSIIKVEVHLSNIYEREDFRKINYIKDVVDGSFYGKKEGSYVDAVTFILEKLS